MLTSQPFTRTTDYRDQLTQELARRKARNRAYSARAFARHLGINKTSLCDAMARRRHLSVAAAKKIAEPLAMTPGEVEVMLLQIRGIGPERFDTSFVRIEQDVFELIAGWRHYAILSLAEIAGTSADAGTVARRLGIPTPIAR